MSSVPPIELFEGTGTLEECENFIRSVRTAAWKQGKLRDTIWMADLASLHFSRNALLWYSQLPEDVSRDWYKLQNSLLSRWAPLESNSRTQIEPLHYSGQNDAFSARANCAGIPAQNLPHLPYRESGGRFSPRSFTSENAASRPVTPATVFSQNRVSQVNPSARAILKVVDESNAEYFVTFREDKYIFGLTRTAKEACRIRCGSLSSFTVLEPIDSLRHSWLAVHWYPKDPQIRRGSADYAYLTHVYSDNLKSSWNSGSPVQLMRCTVSANCDVTSIWATEDGSSIALYPLIHGALIFFVADPEACCKHNPNAKRARLLLKSIDQA